MEKAEKKVTKEAVSIWGEAARSFFLPDRKLTLDYGALNFLFFLISHYSLTGVLESTNL